MIDIFDVDCEGISYKSVGDCPKCGDVVEYIGYMHNNQPIKGTGFKSHIGRCIKCKSEYTITEDS